MFTVMCEQSDNPTGARQRFQSRFGRKPRVPGQRVKRFELVMAESEHEDLKDVAKECGHESVADFVRVAVNDAVADYREKRLFQRRKTERPDSPGRRHDDRKH
jgi:hypothetical protein